MLACAMALVFLLDGSSSVGPAAWEMQTGGTADALQHEIIAHAIDNMEDGIAVTVISFGSFQDVRIPWTHIKSPEERIVFLNRLRETTRGDIGGGTRLPEAMQKTLDHLEETPCQTEIKTVDLSTDGIVGEEAKITSLRDTYVMKNIRLNALGFGTFTGLDNFLNEIIKTPNGFSLVAETKEDYALAIRRKIIMEISQR